MWCRFIFLIEVVDDGFEVIKVICDLEISCSGGFEEVVVVVECIEEMDENFE